MAKGKTPRAVQDAQWDWSELAADRAREVFKDTYDGNLAQVSRDLGVSYTTVRDVWMYYRRREPSVALAVALRAKYGKTIGYWLGVDHA